MHTLDAIYAALHGIGFVCFIHMEFQLHCHELFQLLLDERSTILQQQVEVSKSSSILYFLYFEIISQHLLLGFPLKCSIDIRTSKNFLFCTANFYFCSRRLFHRVFSREHLAIFYASCWKQKVACFFL